MHPAAPLRPSQSGLRGKFSSHGGSLAGDVQRHRGVATGGVPGCIGRVTAAIPVRAGPLGRGANAFHGRSALGLGLDGFVDQRRAGGRKVNRALGAARNHRPMATADSASHCPAVLRQAVPGLLQCRLCIAAGSGLAQCSRCLAQFARCAPRPVPAARRGGRRCLSACTVSHKKAASRFAMWGLLLPFVGPVPCAAGGPRPAARAVERKRQTPAKRCPARMAGDTGAFIKTPANFTSASRSDFFSTCTRLPHRPRRHARGWPPSQCAAIVSQQAGVVGCSRP